MVSEKLSFNFFVLLHLWFLASFFSRTSRATADIPVLSDEHGVTDASSGIVDIRNPTSKEDDINDTQTYYTHSIIRDPKVESEYWVDMDSHKYMKINEVLSKSHRRSTTLLLSFPFPFYGHMIRNVTIATGGFLYTGDYVHSWPAATQYIAPLMANFDTRLKNDSFVKYADNGTALTVLWENFVLQDTPSLGEFSFEVTLVNNGDIIFVYKKVPFSVVLIKDDDHPVKVGLSDAYIMDRHDSLVGRQTTNEYHRIEIGKSSITNGAVIILRSLPSCMNSKSCDTCLSPNNDHLKCSWCESTSLCSTGIDRYRQQWLQKKCDKTSLMQREKCPAVSISSHSLESAGIHPFNDVPQENKSISWWQVSAITFSVILMLLICIMTITVCVRKRSSMFEFFSLKNM